MGIPAFYRWLNERYPLSVFDVIEEEAASINGVEVPIDSSRPNPNGLEFDNLYLDMNGIIHPCFHPDGMEAPKSYEEVFTTVFKYIDRIFAIVRPRKLLYMAIDGVAPRAKMNQQRTRRFRTAKDAADAADAVAKDVKVFESEAAESSVLASNVLDSNVITPGTEFMASLTSALQYYICLKMNTDPGWQGIKVILSDANVPGEGEHKIMSYIRLQRNLPGFDPNTRHCLYGLDADLIMLALATHEVHFSILREDVRNVSISSKDIGKKHKECKWELGNMGNEDYITRQKFQFLNIWILRDYLWHDMAIPDLDGADLERLIDDFVFMCIFVGNDFLPHVPSLEISEGAIDLLMNVYKKEFAQKGCYLTDSFRVNLENVEHFIQAVGSYEKAIFKRRSQVKWHHESRLQGHANYGSSKESLTKKNFWSSFDFTQSLKDPALQSSDHKPGSSVTPDGTSVSIDNIKLGEEGWKMRFYAEKFETENEEELGKIQTHAVLKYIEGICWVMHYYYQGVCSWQWFYPYHYAPFASDFNGLDHLEIHFTLGEPFKPFDQLMGVLPAASAHALPLYYRKLMTDSSSPILDFYPADFELDMNGKRFSWQAICKLPFIEESRLLAEIAKVEHTLTDEEKQRNSLGRDVLFVHSLNPLAAKIFSFYKRKKDHPKLSIAKVRRKINAKVSGGMNGFMYISDKAVWPPEICSPIGDMETITANKVISVYYNYPPTHPHIPRPPEGVVIPKMAVTKSDILPAPVLWHEKSAIFERAASERYIRNSISGSRLTKLAHRLVVKYYLQEKAVSVKHDTKIVPYDNSVQANMENMIHDKYVESGERSCMNDVKMPNGRDAGDDQKIICHPNLMVQEKKVDENERGCMNDAKPRKKRHRDTGDGEIVTCPSNSEGMAHKKKVDGDERSCMSGAEPGKRKHSDAGDGQSIKPKKRRKSRNIALEESILSC